MRVDDDDPRIREIMDGLLGDSYELSLASCGTEALQLAEKLCPRSGNIPDDDRLGGPPSGADGYLLKPFEFGDLFATIEGVLGPQ